MGAEGGGGSVTSSFCGSRSRPIVTVIKTIRATAAAGAQIQRKPAETAGAYWAGLRANSNGGTGSSCSLWSLTTSATIRRQRSHFDRWNSTRALLFWLSASSTYAAIVWSSGHVHRRVGGFSLLSDRIAGKISSPMANFGGVGVVSGMLALLPYCTDTLQISPPFF